MAENSIVSMNVPDAVVKDIVEKQIEAGVIAALGNAPLLVENLVRQTLNVKVDSNGAPDRYNNSNSPTFLTWSFGNAIRQAAKKALSSWCERNEKLIEKALEKELKASTGKIAKMVVATLSESAQRNYRVQVNVAGLDD